MKKILAFVLTLAMMLTLLNVGLISTAAKTADGPIVEITDQTTVTVDGTEYTVVDALPTTAGNYILKQDVVATAGYTFPAGVVLHGNGYTITLQGNAVATPALAAPFNLPEGAEGNAATVVITNVNFGTATAPIYLKADEIKNDTETGCMATTVRKDIGLFANDSVEYDFVEDATAGTVTEGEFFSTYCDVTFDSVTFNVSILAVDGECNVGGIMGTLCGNHYLTNCTMNATVNAGDANAAASAKYGYAGLYYGRVRGMGSVAMMGCVTTVASEITNNYTCGGFIGEAIVQGEAGVELIDCENHAKVSAADAAVGGFIGWSQTNYTNDVEGNLFVLTALTNYGDIYSNIGVANEGAGGIVGHVYYNKLPGATTDPDVTIESCVNYGNLYTKGYAGGIVCISRLGKYGYDKGTMTFNNCVNYGIIEDMDPRPNSETGVQCLKGGLFSRPYGKAIMNNCGNYGSILEGDTNTGSGDQIGGFIGGTWTPQVPESYTGEWTKLVNCVNYGAVMTGRRVGGFAGTGEIPMTFENCVNYGTTGDCAAAIGGFVGYNAPLVDSNGISYRCDLTFKNCVNFGSTTDTDTSAGFVGNGYNCAFENCINLADLDGTGNVGGFVGWHRTGFLTLKDCANVGGSWGYGSGSGGNIAGNVASASAFTIENFLSYGLFTDFAGDPKLGGLIGGNCVIEPVEGADADFFAEVLADEEPDNANLEWQDSAEEAAEIINARLAALGLAECVYATEENTLMVVNPMLRGIQTSEIVDGKVDVRILGAVDGNLPFYDDVIGREYDTIVLNYKVVGYTSEDSIEALENRIEAAEENTVDMVLYESINNVIGFNDLLQEKEVETITNYDMAAQFIAGGVIKDVDVTTGDEEAVVIVANMTTILAGVEYDTTTYVFVMMYGEVVMVVPYDAWFAA